MGSESTCCPSIVWTISSNHHRRADRNEIVVRIEKKTMRGEDLERPVLASVLTSLF